MSDNICGLVVYPQSVTKVEDVTYFIGSRDGEKFVAMIGDGVIAGLELGQHDGMTVVAGAMNPANASAIRSVIDWTKPSLVGMATSVGLGDRLGLAGPGHIRSVRDSGVAVILAQQSIRELQRTGRDCQEVIDAATWAVLQEGFSDGFGSDADHLQKTEDIDITAAAGFTMFTIDPGAYVNDDADTLDYDVLERLYNEIDFSTLEISAADLRKAYVDVRFPLAGGGEISLDETGFLRAAVKYGPAVGHTARMYRHLKDVATGPVELEVSVDETESPTTTAEHYFFAAELKRLGVEWVSLAPRFVGRFEKGVDYIGDLDEFRDSFASHVAVMRTLGPYKMSIHSGSDKFSIYPITVAETKGLVHLKTAGTSYLEALRAISQIDPDLYRTILDFARNRYEIDKATYHVSADVSKVPAGCDLSDDQLGLLLDEFNAREVLHVTFGSVLSDTSEGGMRERLYAALISNENAHYDVLEKHLGRHVEPLARGLAR